MGFGIIDTSHAPAIGYMEVVTSSDAATHLPIILAHVATGGIAHSDQWSVLSSSHQMANHSVTFVDPKIHVGVHAHTKY